MTKTTALKQITLNFLGLVVTIKSDSERYLDIFRQMYARFETEQAQPDTEFVVLTTADNEWQQPVILSDDRVQRLGNISFSRAYVYEAVFNNIIAQIQSHYLIHAGVVAHQGKGLILAADSGHGKTTLTLSLVQRGCQFLSDEMAAINRTSQQVHPFPRSLRLRPDTLERVGFTEAAQQGKMWLDKLLLDIEQIKPESLGQQAVTLGYVIILKNPAEVETSSAQQPLQILVDRLADSFLAEIEQLDDVSIIETGIDRDYPLIKLHAKNRTAALSQIEAICQRQQVILLDVIKRTTTRPQFETAARLEPLPASKAALELLRHFQGGHKSNLLQEEFGGSSTRLFMNLMSLLNQAQCYQLFVGPLPQNVNLVSDLLAL